MAEIKVRDIAKALYNGNIATFSKGAINEQEATDIVTNAILDVCDCREKFNMNKFQANKYKVFEILEDVLSEPVMTGVIPEYNQFADIVSVGYNETYAFKVLDNSLFEVGVVAGGTSDFHRQRLINGRLNLTSFQLGVKIYEEFHALRTGQVNFTQMIDNVKKSFDVKIMNMIAVMMKEAYTSLDAKYLVKSTFDEVKLTELVERVNAKSGKKATIYGTASALTNLLRNHVISESDKEDFRKNGHVTMWNGIKVVKLPQALDANDDFVVDNKTLLVIPDGEKIVKLLMEGDAEVNDRSSEDYRDDQQFEFSFMQRIQIGVAKSSIYGAYEIA